MDLAMLVQLEEYGEFETTGGGSALFGGAMMIVWLAVAALVIASLWVVFTKAGKPGWAAIVPIYNYMVMAEVGGKPNWWGLLTLIPCAGPIFGIIILVGVAKAFGKGGGYVVGMIFLPIIFFPMLAWGNATYQGAGTQPPAAA